MDPSRVKNILEAALFAAGRPLTLAQMGALFGEQDQPGHEAISRGLEALGADYEGRGLTLVEVANGFRIQTALDTAEYVSRLWEERPSRYSRALLETLSLIAYRQPITRGEIEDVRGVSVSSSIIKTLLEREWVRVIGHRDVPGRPAMYGTTREFLDYFGLKRLNELPPLSELRDIDSINVELDLKMPGEAAGATAQEATDTEFPEAGSSTVEGDDTDGETVVEGRSGDTDLTDETGDVSGSVGGDEYASNSNSNPGTGTGTGRETDHATGETDAEGAGLASAAGSSVVGEDRS